MSAGSSRVGAGILLLIVLAVVGSAVFLFLWEPADDPGKGKVAGGNGETTSDNTTRAYTAEEYAAFYELANKGLAWLENKEFVTAEQTFEALHEAQPDEMLPIRNLAITRAMMVVDDDSVLVKDRLKNDQAQAAYGQAVELARETFTELEKRDKPLALLLAGLVSMKEGSSDRGIKELEQAARAKPDDPSYWFALYDAHGELREPDDGKPYPLAAEAIETALRLAPENLHAIGEAIQTQAKASSPRLVETLAAAKPVVAPLADSIQKRTRFDILAGFDRAIDALKADPTKTVFARQIANVLRPDIAKRIDQRIIAKNLLEYVATHFGDSFDSKATAAGFQPHREEPIDVAFATAETTLPDTSGATDLRVADMNLDGIPDIVIARNNTIEVYGRRANEQGLPEGEWVQIATVGAPEGASFDRFVLADIDRDYEESSASKTYRVIHEGTGVPRFDQTPNYIFTDTDPDVIAFGQSGVTLLRNDRANTGGGLSFNRSFSVVAVEDAGFAALSNIADVAVSDVEHDGDLDLIVGSDSGLSFWINQSNKREIRFANGNVGVGAIPEGEVVQSITPIDWNRDIANDLLVTTDKSLGLMQNVLHGRFRWRTLADVGANTAVVGDFNGDAAWDVVLGSQSGLEFRLLSPASDEGTEWLSSQPFGEQPVSGLTLLDYDNDGVQDLIALEAAGVKIYRGAPDGSFAATTLADDWPAETTAVDAADIDLDGDEDVALVAGGTATLRSNEGGNANNWFRMTLRPEPNPEQFPANRVNMHGLGTVLELKAGSRYQARVVSRPVTHFGLGQREQADAIRIIWTDGIPQNLIDEPSPKESLTVLAPQYLGGSCPYLYTWNGERFVFYSDCLWAAPLGLQQAEGVFAPSREWEYIRIDGNFLKPRDGKYELQITEELWEATYLDQVKLIAVDHPHGTQIFSNEKVGPPQLTEFRIHTVASPRTPVAATNQNGTDLLPQLREADGDYVRAFDRRIKQGLTTEHFIEFDLGELQDPQQVTLFLVGWVFPTDTNINIGIDQSGEAPPRPPAIQVPDENGEWADAIPFAGFPGGKTKTIAIDLSGRFRSDDYRVRLLSSMELYWDAAFFTVDEPEVAIRQTELPLASAHLHYRGFSKRRFGGSVFTTDGFGPEQYDYYDVRTDPTWLPMDGRFTRYGDVRPLLTAGDDMQVVFGAGDEITLRFDAAQHPVPDGMVRDFLLYNVGWDKDVKQNTVYGQTVEPLPTAGMKSYTGIDPPFPDTEEHREFLRKWQTRTQSARRFRNWVREFDTSTRKSSE